MTETPPDALPETDLPEQMRVRHDKRERLLAEGSRRTRSASPAPTPWRRCASSGATSRPGEETQDVVGVAGRVIFVRNTGKLCFATLQEGAGIRLQVMLSLAEVGEEAARRRGRATSTSATTSSSRVA